MIAAVAATCDSALALYARTDAGSGCHLHAVVHAPDVWQLLAVFVVGFVLACLAALVVLQAVRRG